MQEYKSSWCSHVVTMLMRSLKCLFADLARFLLILNNYFYRETFWRVVHLTQTNLLERYLYDTQKETSGRRARWGGTLRVASTGVKASHPDSNLDTHGNKTSGINELFTNWQGALVTDEKVLSWRVIVEYVTMSPCKQQQVMMTGMSIALLRWSSRTMDSSPHTWLTVNEQNHSSLSKRNQVSHRTHSPYSQGQKSCITLQN